MARSTRTRGDGSKPGSQRGEHAIALNLAQNTLDFCSIRWERDLGSVIGVPPNVSNAAGATPPALPSYCRSTGQDTTMQSSMRARTPPGITRRGFLFLFQRSSHTAMKTGTLSAGRKLPAKASTAASVVCEHCRR